MLAEFFYLGGVDESLKSPLFIGGKANSSFPPAGVGPRE